MRHNNMKNLKKKKIVQQKSGNIKNKFMHKQASYEKIHKQMKI